MVTNDSELNDIPFETVMANISEDGDFTDFNLESEDGVNVPVHGNLLAALFGGRTRNEQAVCGEHGRDVPSR